MAAAAAVVNDDDDDDDDDDGGDCGDCGVHRMGWCRLWSQKCYQMVNMTFTQRGESLKT